MTFFSKLTKNYIYRHTKKPTRYVHVDTPKTLQEHRQVQFNNWCKAKGVYCGSYLPAKPEKLTAAGKKGWEETTNPKNRTGIIREFKRKSSGQWVSFHDKHIEHGVLIDPHYHWHEYDFQKERRIKKHLATKNNPLIYRDRYGIICKDSSPESHLAPLDKKFNYKKVPKNVKKRD